MPEFAQKTYSLNVSEDTTIGLPLLALTILNRDSNAQLDFSLQHEPLRDLVSATARQLDDEDNDDVWLLNDVSSPFGFTRPQPSTQANKAYLILDRPLAYKKRRAYSLRVKCVDLLDGLYSTALVHIRVQPNTNFRPRFERDIYNFDVWENSSIGWLVGQVHAIGVTDASETTTVVYKLLSTDLDESQLVASGSSSQYLAEPGRYSLNGEFILIYFTSPK